MTIRECVCQGRAQHSAIPIKYNNCSSDYRAPLIHTIRYDKNPNFQLFSIDVRLDGNFRVFAIIVCSSLAIDYLIEDNSMLKK